MIPHAGQPVLRAGQSPDRARAAMILVHGRGADARSILSLTAELPSDGFCFLAPEAGGHTWYPHSFLEPIERNEPGLSSGLSVLGGLLQELAAEGVPPEKTILLGFSQGACLASEFVAQNAQRLGGLVVLSGGLIGPDGTPRDYRGNLDGTPVFVGCSDVDPHIPESRVHETATVLEDLGAVVTKRLYPGMAHIVNGEEIEHTRAMMNALSDTA